MGKRKKGRSDEKAKPDGSMPLLRRLFCCSCKGRTNDEVQGKDFENTESSPSFQVLHHESASSKPLEIKEPRQQKPTFRTKKETVASRPPTIEEPEQRQQQQQQQQQRQQQQRQQQQHQWNEPQMVEQKSTTPKPSLTTEPEQQQQQPELQFQEKKGTTPKPSLTTEPEQQQQQPELQLQEKKLRLSLTKDHETQQLQYQPSSPEQKKFRNNLRFDTRNGSKNAFVYLKDGYKRMTKEVDAGRNASERANTQAKNNSCESVDQKKGYLINDDATILKEKRGNDHYGYNDEANESSSLYSKTPLDADETSGKCYDAVGNEAVGNKMPTPETKVIDLSCLSSKPEPFKEVINSEPKSVDSGVPGDEHCAIDIYVNNPDGSVTKNAGTVGLNSDVPSEDEWKIATDDSSQWRTIEHEELDYSQITDSQDHKMDFDTVYDETIQSDGMSSSETNSKAMLEAPVVLKDEKKIDYTDKRNEKRAEKKKKNGRKHGSGRSAHNSEASDNSGELSSGEQDNNCISLSQMRPKPPKGLTNLGNTCFFNSVMQNLNQSFLLELCLSSYLKTADEKHHFSLIKAMCNFYKSMNSSDSSCFNPSSVFRNVCKRSSRFEGFRQQDSHELLRHLLDGLRAEEREVFPQSKRRTVLTNVDKVFGGHFLTVYTCENCKTPYHVCEPMLDISLPIAFDDDDFGSDDKMEDSSSVQSGSNADLTDLDYRLAAEYFMCPLNENGLKQEKVDNNYDSGKSSESSSQRRKRKKRNKAENPSCKRSKKERSVLECLKAFTRVESIKEEYLCMRCNASEGAEEPIMTSAKKRTLIYNPPALLTLHLKRFEQAEKGFVKCNDTISFETELDLSPYCSQLCKRNEGNEKNIWYSLYGVVVHGGSLSGGHYVAYVNERSSYENTNQFLQQEFLDRNRLTADDLVGQWKGSRDKTTTDFLTEWNPKLKNGRWHYISDSHFSHASKCDVLSQQAYLLFYERVSSGNIRKHSAEPSTDSL